MRFSTLLLMGGILLLSACGADENSGFSFNRDVPPEAKSNGTVTSVLEFSPNLSKHFELVAGQGRACVFGRRTAGLSSEDFLSCWGRRIHPNDREQVSGVVNGDNKVLSIGEDHVCTTLTTFSAVRVHCDGSNAFGENTDPDAIGHLDVPGGHWLKRPSLVASGDRHNCALDEYGVYCWGDNRKGQTKAPVLTDPKWVSAGGDTSCAIDADNQPVCWGDNSAGQTEIPDGLTFVTGLAVGSDFVCAVNVGSVECWGNTSEWDADPGTYTEVTHISAGKDHACILDQVATDSVSAECFGKASSTNDLLAVPSAIQANIRTISAGHGFTCASNNYAGYEWSDSNDDSVYESEQQLGVLCWGDNSENQTVTPREICLGYSDQAIPKDERTCPEY